MNIDKIIKRMKHIDDNISEFDSLTMDGTHYYDVHETIYQAIDALGELKAYREAFGSLDIPGISFGKRLAEALTKIEEIRNNERE